MGTAQHPQNSKAAKFLTVILAILFLGEALWIWTNAPVKPEFSKVILDIAVNDHIHIYGAAQDSGGATVPFVYHYFIQKKASNAPSLSSLQDEQAFLRTREPAQINVDNGRIKVTVAGQILAFASRASYQDDGLKFVDIDLTAIQP
jgi:hypothetical protein